VIETGKKMATTSRGRARDRALIAPGRDHHIKFQAKKERVPAGAAKYAPKEARNTRENVGAKLECK